ncbi:6125_t:CDS:2, partial [Entrophospora sp. SA101]
STMSSSSRKAYVVGVGLTKFIKPGSAIDYPEMALESTVKALLDAGIIYDDIQQAYVGYIYGDSTCGQRALYQLGMTQIPIMAIESGSIDCALALGFEKMKPGPMNSIFKDRTFPIVEVSSSIKDLDNSPLMAQLFGNAGIEYCNKYNATYDHMAKISEKNHLHSSKNPYSQYNKIYTLEQIKSSPKICGPLTNLQCCPTSDGSATVILASETFIKKNKLENQSIEIVDQILSTDSPSLLDTKSFMDLVGFNMTKIAAMKIYERSGVYPNDIQLITYDALGLCKPGESHKLIESGDTTYGGKYVINPSGGLLSKGHPVGATGLAQCIELVWQLREWATNRQVSNIKYALQHNLGLGGAVVISIYKKPKFFSLNNNVDGRKRLGYNPAIESKGITTNDLDKVKSKSDYNNQTWQRRFMVQNEENSVKTNGISSAPDFFTNTTENIFALFKKETGRSYSNFKFFGNNESDLLIVTFGSNLLQNFIGSDFLDFGLIQVRLYRPWYSQLFCNAIPKKSIKKVLVLEQVFTSTTKWLPLYLDVTSFFHNKKYWNNHVPFIIGGQYGNNLNDKSIGLHVKNLLHDLKSAKLHDNINLGEELVKKSQENNINGHITTTTTDSIISNKNNVDAIIAESKLEKPYLNMLNEIFADRLFIANAISKPNAGYFEAIKSTPEFGYGVLISKLQKRSQLVDFVSSALKNEKIPESLHVALSQWILSKDDADKSKEFGETAISLLYKLHKD